MGITKRYTNKSTPMWGFCQTKFKLPSDTVNPVKEKPFPKMPVACCSLIGFASAEPGSFCAPFAAAQIVLMFLPRGQSFIFGVTQ